jgi:hypothetical protein
MPRYFFNVRHGRTVFEDRQGRDFADLPSAWDWAVQDARTIADLDVLNGQHEEQWIEIGDENGAVVASLPFRRTAQTLH